MVPQRFILVDDNEADNVFHEIMIRRGGFTGELLVFEGGAEALAFLREDDLSKPTCIFLDINMPLMDGFEFASAVTPLIGGQPTVLLMMLTSSDAPQDQQRAREMPVIQGFLTKPLTAQQVRNLLERD